MRLTSRLRHACESPTFARQLDELAVRVSLETGLSQTDGITHLEYRVVR